jgi:hypothetical protein
VGLRVLFLLAAGAAALTANRPAVAGLMGSTYDLLLVGPVREGGNMSIEQYEGTDLVYGDDELLPNTMSPTPVPPFTSTSSRVNRVEHPVISNGTSGNAIFWIKGPEGALSANEAFANDLDPDELVLLRLTLHWDDLPDGEKIIITDVNGENGNIPDVFYDPASYSSTGTGAHDDPLVLSIYIDPFDVQEASFFHFLKVEIEFDTMEIPIPEPAAATLIILGLASAAVLRRRQR